MTKTEEVKREILRKFIYNKKLKYNEIWEKKICSSSHFDYYLKQVINENFIIKKDEYYILTNKGINLVSALDGKSIINNKKPVPCSFVIGYKDGKVLLNIRAKQPFLGYLNIPGGKIELGITAKQQAINEYVDETGLIPLDLKLKCISEKISYDIKNKEVAHHILGFTYIATKFKGELLENTREGENFWIEIDKIKNHKRFGDIDFIINHAINGRGVKIIKVIRDIKDGEIVDFKIEEI